MKYCFGPVPSRRLGLSLGIDILPLKTCNLNCIYCELGRTGSYTCGPVEGPSPQEILREFRQYMEENRPALDVVTITASGEPTLHQGLREIVAGLKEVAGRPVVVLTNGTMLGERAVCEALQEADLVLPSLDAASDTAFRRVNRPCPGLDVHEIIEGLARFRRGFRGRIWLEILLVQGVNDSEEELQGLVEAVERIRPHKVQLNTVARPPAEEWARPLSHRRLQEIAALFPVETEVATSPPSKGKGSYKDLMARVAEMLGRRPMTASDMEQALGRSGAEIEEALRGLLERGRVEPYEFQGKRYFRRRFQG